MKTLNQLRPALFISAFVFLVIAINNPIAQTKNLSGKISVLLDKNSVQNFLNGLISDNTGLRKSCIFFAGKYKLDVAVLPLMAQLRKEKDSDTKILISLALFEIGDARGMYLVKVLSDKDDDEKVRKRCSAIYENYVKNQSDCFATL